MGIAVLLFPHSHVGYGLTWLHLQQPLASVLPQQWSLQSQAPGAPGSPIAACAGCALGPGQRLLTGFAEEETEVHRKVRALPISHSRSAVGLALVFQILHSLHH